MDEAKRPSTLSQLSKVYNALKAGRGCLLCGARCGEAGLCRGCVDDLAPAGRLRRPAFVGAVVAARAYRYPLDRLVQQAKFEHDLAAVHACSALFASEVSDHLQRCDLVVPVPLSRRRYLARGFNLAAEMALALGRRIEVAVDTSCLVRRRHGVPQSGLPAADRRANVAGAFRATRALAGTRVLVVDDVVTTGATVSSAAAALRSAGALCVDVAALAAAA
ncbi:MAG: ComF family protein [Gammaproteobacteria bacterium]